MSEEWLINKTVQLQKMPGKGGWTYVLVPEIKPAANKPFGWQLVKGSIDDYHFSNYHLMPMGNGCLFLPVKAAVRKLINKQAGDWVTVKINFDTDLPNIPEDLLLSLKDEPKALDAFFNLTADVQKNIIHQIINAGNIDKQIKYMALIINNLAAGKFKT
ncbi:MAG: YdeI/OmpD-associated family protein [Chitinophagaceae bacterium]